MSLRQPRVTIADDVHLWNGWENLRHKLKLHTGRKEQKRAEKTFALAKKYEKKISKFERENQA